MSQLLQVNLIKESTMNGNNFIDTAYIDAEVANLICVELGNEHVDFSVYPFEGEIIINERCIVEGRVYKLSDMCISQKRYEIALGKLSQEEIKAFEMHHLIKEK